MGLLHVEGARELSQAEIAYEAIAPVYDEFTAHYDTEAWLSDLLPHLERCGLSGNRLLDVGCGTGESFIPMLARDWQVTGCDISPAMLARARAKVGEAASLSVADMRDLPQLGSFDLVWALDDAINYLLSLEELEAALSGMRENLAPGGLVMFDVNTLLVYRTFFAERNVVERDGKRMVWNGQADKSVEAGSICEALFGVEGDSTEASPHVHRQRHFPEAEVLAALASAGLKPLAVLGHGLDGVPKQSLDESSHTKAVYIACAVPIEA
jgi:SAM-dependent methyltransferase